MRLPCRRKSRSGDEKTIEMPREHEAETEMIGARSRRKMSGASRHNHKFNYFKILIPL